MPGSGRRDIRSRWHGRPGRKPSGGLVTVMWLTPYQGGVLLGRLRRRSQIDGEGVSLRRIPAVGSGRGPGGVGGVTRLGRRGDGVRSGGMRRLRGTERAGRGWKRGIGDNPPRQARGLVLARPGVLQRIHSTGYLPPEEPPAASGSASSFASTRRDWSPRRRMVTPGLERSA